MLGLLALAAFAASPPTTPREVIVEAGSRERRDCVVSFAFGSRGHGESYRLRDADGSEVPLQVDGEGRAFFVLNQLAAGGRKAFKVVVRSAPLGERGGIETVRDGDAIELLGNGRRVLRYQGGEGLLPSARVAPVFRRGGYIHPVYTPTGRAVTDDYPPDHRHHHGIWFAWTRTEFEGRAPDFWNMGQGTGSVVFASLDEVWSGPVHGGLRARHRYLDLKADPSATVLREAWEARAYAVGTGARPYALFDLEVSQEAATTSPLALPEYHYGGLGFRGAPEWLGAENAFFLTSEGKDRKTGHGTRARWCHVGGRVRGELAGVAILDHRGNFRAPQPMRIHPTEPFFCYAPSQLGRWEIAAGTRYLSRYRFVVQDGAPDPGELDRMWADYADPPRVVVR